MPTCFDAADFFIANAEPNEGITHLKLQEMCAYAQAFSLILLRRRLMTPPKLFDYFLLFAFSNKQHRGEPVGFPL
jgi:hypothetical protein